MNSLLLKPNWTAKNVASYVGCGLTKAYKIMAQCRAKYNGTIKELPNCVKRNSVLALLGTDIDTELNILKGGKASEKTVSQGKV